jgi:hypothetical protein
MPSFADIVAAETVVSEELPLVHTTRCEVLPEILNKHELRGGECDVFHEHLVYFFYGRPAYRYALGRNPGGGIELCPVCFVFKPHTVGKDAKRVFPCDSGGVYADRFAPHLKKADLPELELNPTLGSARRLVPLVFGSNGTYFLGKALVSAPSSFATGSAAQRFHALLRDATMSSGDDRRSAIEVQLQSPVPLDHHLLYVMLPKEFLNQADVRRAIFEIWQCEPIGYEVYEGAPAQEYTATIRDKLLSRFKDGTRL